MRWRIIGALVLVIAVVAGVFVWISRDTSGFRDIGSGVSVNNDAPNGVKAAVDSKATTPFGTDLVTPLGSVVHVTPDGPIKQITLRFKLSQKITDKDEVLIATSQTGQPGSWQVVPVASVSADGQYAYVTTTHLSWWQPIWRNIKKLINAFKEEIKKGIDDLTGNATATADQPKCDGESDVRKQGYSIQSAGDSLYWCLGLDGGKPTLKVVDKRRYPLLIGHPNLTVKYLTKSGWDAGWLAKKLTAKGKTTLMPFDEADFGVNNLPDGGTAALGAEYNGLAQSLYQLEFGVQTASSILTRFGAGEGVVSGGKITKTAFDQVAKRTRDFLDIKDCGNLVFNPDKANFGSIMSACFDAATIMEVFGWRGLLIAPAMVALPVVNFFRSEFNALGDLINHRDRYRIVITYKKPNPLPSYVGTWYVHGVVFVVKADGTGLMTFNAGPCLDPFQFPGGPMCSGKTALRFAPNNDGSLTGTYGATTYVTGDGTPPPSGFDPSTVGARAAGTTFRLQHSGSHMLETSDGNHYCDRPGMVQCGA